MTLALDSSSLNSDFGPGRFLGEFAGEGLSPTLSPKGRVGHASNTYLHHTPVHSTSWWYHHPPPTTPGKRPPLSLRVDKGTDASDERVAATQRYLVANLAGGIPESPRNLQLTSFCTSTGSQKMILTTGPHRGPHRLHAQTNHQFLAAHASSKSSQVPGTWAPLWLSLQNFVLWHMQPAHNGLAEGLRSAGRLPIQ